MQPVLRTHGVALAFGANAPLFHDVTLDLTPGWTALVGANGAGKTTLLRVLARELAPTEGEVQLVPRDAVVTLCPQAVHELDANVRAFAERPGELHGRLELDADALERWETLSPGERKRWQIGAALDAAPDVLLLDEPTNHLDDGARRLLVGALRRFRGVGIVVSHDRALLDALARTTIRVHDTRVSAYRADYATAARTWEGERAARERDHDAAQRRVRAIAHKLDDARRTQAAADHARSSSSRMKGPRDHDARGSLAKGMAAAAEARAGRSVTTARRELDRARDAVPWVERDRTIGGEIYARFVRAPTPVLFDLDRPELLAGDHVVLRDVRLRIGRDDRVRIAGPNGAGKTTLLRALLEPRRDRILYLPQELTPADVAARLVELAALDADARGRVLAVFAALGSDPVRVLGRRDGLSPGEARKLVLALGLGNAAWALVLDEPTNHLDLPTIERLERALADYPGCIVLATHDDAFARAVTTTTFALDARAG